MVALSATPVLTTERLALRAPAAADWPAWRDFVATERSHWIGGPLTEPGQAWRAFGHIIGHWVLRGFGMFVVTDKATGAPLGMTGPWFPDGWPEPEIGWNLWTADAEGRGIAHEAALAARAHAARDLGLTGLVSYIEPGNVRSIALAQRMGAVRDPDAAFPGTKPCLVFRHPQPEAA